MNPTGVIFVFLSGFISSFAPMPLKIMRRFGYAHWGVISSLLGYLLVPWALLFALCPGFRAGLADIPLRAFLVANGFSLAWGIGNILCLLCLVRIGFSLTFGILSGITIPIGVVTPMILKGSGEFAHAPDPLSRGGLVILAGVVLMLAAVALLSRAGFARDAVRKAREPAASSATTSRGGFLIGLVMCIASGFFSIGMSFSFVYTQDAFGQAFLANGMPAAAVPVAVRIVTLLGGGVVNLLYPAFLLCRDRSWGAFAGKEAPHDLPLAATIGLVTIASIILGGMGMSLLGPWGPSVGFGVSMSMSIVSSQSIGFLFGEWRGVPRRTVRTALAAILLLILAVAVIVVGNARG